MLGTSTGDSHYFSLPVKCQESQTKSRSSSKAASQLTSLADCRYLQKMCAAKHGWGSARSAQQQDLILQACQSITKLKEKCPPRPASSYTAILSWRWKAGKPFLFHYPHLDCWETNASFLVSFCAGWAFGPHHSSSSDCLLGPNEGVQICRRVKRNMNPGRDFNLCFWSHVEIPLLLCAVPYSKDTYWINLNNEWMRRDCYLVCTYKKAKLVKLIIHCELFT